MPTRASLLVVALVVFAGCTGAPPSSPAASGAPDSSWAPPSSAEPSPAVEPSPTGDAEPSAAGTGLLLTVGFRGGHCRTGPCDRTVGIDTEGGVHLVAPERQELGVLSPELLHEVQEQLSLADFEQLGSRPFTGECPVNFDGQELIYTFYAATAEIRLASCEVALDAAHPLFVAIENALAAMPSP